MKDYPQAAGIVMLAFMIFIGVIAYKDQQRINRQYFSPRPEQVKASRDETAASLCPAYLEAGAWKQATRYSELDWCEEYRDKVEWKGAAERSLARREARDLPTGPARISW